MRTVFADTFYWVALANPRDPWHERARAASISLGRARLVTTDEVLTEFLTFLSSYGTAMRHAAVRLAESILADPNIDVLPQTHASFLAGLRLYGSRPDKGYSLTDCISMEAMREHGCSEVLTHDRHFTQEGLTILLGD